MRVSLIHFFHDFFQSFFVSNLPQCLFKLNFLVNFGNYDAFHTASILRLEQLSYKKVLDFVLLDNYFTDLFAEVKTRYRKTFKFGPGRFLER